MDSIIELHVGGIWRPAASLSVSPTSARFEYLPDYVFGDAPQAVALRLPINMEIVTAELRTTTTTDLAFLWDLAPQGRGRQHLANLLGVADQDPGQDLFLAQHGAYAPIGRLRFDTAVQFYQKQTGGPKARGFTLEEMVNRTEDFLEQLVAYSMLAAGTPGVQGVAPKFLLTQDQDERWFPDVALADSQARKHFIVKLPRGRSDVDLQVLRHEAIYLQVAAACGLRSIADPMYLGGMLFLPRFDRQVTSTGVERLHQETLAVLIGAAGFGRSASLFALTEALATCVTRPDEEVAEFLCRDVLNRALRNPDNHLRNTSLQRLGDDTVRLTPLYDLGPMYLDRELITRTCAWSGPQGEILEDWNTILDRLKVDDDVKRAAGQALRHFGEAHLPRLAERLRERGADEAIIEACRPGIEHQARKLQEIGGHADDSTSKP